MFVCNCNGITERQVKAARDAGAKKWDDVHRHYECKPQCGGCGVEIAEMLNDGDVNKAPPLLSAAFAKA